MENKVENKDRFAKYTDQEMIDGIKWIETEISEMTKSLAHFEANKNLEFFEITAHNITEAVQNLMDARRSYMIRLKKREETANAH